MKPTAPAAPRTGPALLLVFVLLAVGIVTGGGFYYRKAAQNSRAEAKRQLAAIAELKAGELAQWRKERLGDAGILHNHPVFTQLARRFFASPADADAQRQLQAWLGKYQAQGPYDRVFLLDAQGAVRMSVPETSVPVAAVMSARAAEVLRSGQPAFQDFFRHELSQRIYLAALVPLFEEADANRPLGVFVLRIDPTSYLYPFIKHWPVPSETAETLLVRREGNEVVFLNELRFQTNTALNFRAPLDRVTMPAVQAALGHECVMAGEDYRSAPVVAALRTIPDSPWALVARMDSAEVFGPLRAQLWQVVAMVGILLFGTGAGVGAVWRQQRVRHYREQAQSVAVLQKERANLDAIFEASPVALFILDETTNIVRVNTAAAVLTGGSALDALQHRPGNALRCVHSSKDPRGCGYAPDCPLCPLCPARNGIEKLIASGGEMHGAELMLELMRNGVPEQVWMEIGAETVQINGRRHLCVAMEDITDRKRAREALRASEAMLTETGRMAKIGGWAIDLEKGTLTWTREVYAIHEVEEGYRPTVEAAINFYAPESRPIIQQTVERAMQTGEPFDVELELISAKHRRIWVQVRGRALLVDGKAQTISGTFQDITDRKRAEQLVRDSEDRLRFALDEIETGAWDLDLIDHSAYRSLKHDQIFGYETLLPRWTYAMFLEHVVPADRATVDQKFQQAIASQGDWHFECRIIRHDGQQRWILASGRHRLDPGGQPRRMVGIVQDITARKQAEEIIHKLNSELEQRIKERTVQLEAANQELEAFSYSVSHDLRAPLRAVDGFSHVLLQDYAKRLDNEGQDYLKRIRAAAKRMGQLIDDMLTLSRISRAALRKQPVDMSALARSILTGLQEAEPQRKVDVQIAENLHAAADPNLLRIALENLLGNAWKFTGKTVQPKLEFGRVVGPLPSAGVAPSAASGDAAYNGPVFFVRDNGAGFDMAYAEKLFGVFQRLHRQDEFPGTGIGLATVARIIHYHGGEVRAEGAVGQGATFFFTLNPAMPLGQETLVVKEKEPT